MGMPIRGKISLQHTSSDIEAFVWVDDIDPIWITVAPKGSPQRLRALMDGHCLVQ